MDVCRSIENMVINPTGRQQAVIVSTLPAAGAENYIYLVPDGDNYSAYKYEDGEWVSVSGGSCDAVIVDTLPEVGEDGKIYLQRRFFGGSSVPGDVTRWVWYSDGFVLAETLPPVTGEGIMITVYVVDGKMYTSGLNGWTDSTEDITGGNTVSIFNEPKNPEDYIGTFGIFTNYENSVMPVMWKGNGYTSFASFPD